MGNFTGGQLMNGLGFLTALPNKGRGYLCLNSETQKWNQCSRNFICESGLQNWKIDYSSPNTYRNWVDPNVLNLTCVSSGVIGLTGTSYFIGFMISSVIVPRLSDTKFGRRQPYIISIIVQLILYVMMFLSKSIYFNIIWFLGIGLCAGGRVCVGLSYMNEFVPEKYHNITTTIMAQGDVCVMIYQALFYLYAPDWIQVHTVAFIISVITVISAFQIPESPKYMYVNRNYNKTRQILKILAKKNKAQITNDEIDQIVFEFELLENDNETKFENEENNDVSIIEQNQEIIKLEGNVSEIFMIWQIRTNFFCLLVILGTITFCYFLINFQLKVVPGDLISLTIVAQLADFVGTMVSGYIYKRFGAKISHISMSAMAAIGSIALLFVWYENSPRIILMCILLTKFGLGAVFNMAYIDFVVLSPTILTPTMFGFCNAFARVTASFSSIFAELDHVISLQILISFCFLQIFASYFLVTKLPRFI